MRYLGGKTKIAKQIATAILADLKDHPRDVLIEPFVGSAAMTTQLAPYFGIVFASDIHEDLILMWQSLAAGWSPPDFISESEYLVLKKSAPSALRGFAGFGYAFAGDWFHGYAKDSRGYDYGGAMVRSTKKRTAILKKNTIFARCDFRGVIDYPGAIIYCDPPYANTAGYAAGPFDTATFWNHCRKWAAAGSRVYVSEYKAPSDWRPIWQREITRNLRGRAGVERVVESVYTI